MMHKKTEILRGLVTHTNGRKETVRVRPTKIYFVDQEGRKFRREDGTMVGGDCTLGIYFLKVEQESAYLKDYPFTGKVRGVQIHSSKKPGPGRDVKLRETKLFYIDETGRKFRKKEGGYSVDNAHRLDLESVQKLDRFKREY